MAERWLKIRAADVKPSTWAGYSKRVKLWAKVFGPMKITDIRKSHIRESLVAYGWTHGKTMANALTVMRGVMELALEDELIRTNPANGIRTPRTQRKRHEPLTASEMNLVLEALESSHWLEYFQVAFSTGMRTNELCGLTWPDVNIDSGKVRIHNSRTNGQDTGSTKTATERTISLKPLALRAIKRQRLKTRGDSHVFTLPDGRPINNDQRAWRPWKAALEKAGISHRRAYETRHTFATLQLMAGAELIEVSRYLGHAKPSMTLDHYADWMDVSEQERELSKTAFS